MSDIRIVLVTGGIEPEWTYKAITYDDNGKPNSLSDFMGYWTDPNELLSVRQFILIANDKSYLIWNGKTLIDSNEKI